MPGRFSSSGRRGEPRTTTILAALIVSNSTHLVFENSCGIESTSIFWLAFVIPFPIEGSDYVRDTICAYIKVTQFDPVQQVRHLYGKSAPEYYMMCPQNVQSRYQSDLS